MKPNTATAIMKAATDTINAINKNEKLVVPLLAIRATKAAYDYPNDQPIRILSNVLNKMAENGNVFISKNEFKTLVSRFAASGNSVINKEFYKEAGSKCNDDEDCDAVEVDEKMVEKKAYAPIDAYLGADKGLSNALGELWGEGGKINKSASIKKFDPELARKASNSLDIVLSKAGYEPKNIVIAGGNEDFIICNAYFETPKGETNMIVPVMTVKSSIVEPSVFVSKYGFVDMNKQSIEEHIKENAGQPFYMKAEDLSNALQSMSKVASLNEFELGVLALQNKVKKGRVEKFASANKEIYLSQNYITASVNEVDKAGNLPIAITRNPDADKFEARLKSASGAADFILGKNVVETGKNIVSQKISEFGYHAKVAVASFDKESVTYACSVYTDGGPVGFEVMADVNHGRVNIPTIMAIQDRAFDFSKDGMHSLISSYASDNKAAAIASPMYDLKPSEIIDNMRQALDHQQYKMAEEALMTLAEKVDDKTYKVAFAEYLAGVGGAKLTKVASKCGCTRIMKVSTHSSPICGHLNMPIDKVYQNEFGECCPKYRQNISDPEVSAVFSNTKILL